jgi:hypothetical protein
MIPDLFLVALITAAVVGLLHWAILKQKAWIGFYRLFVLVFLAVWAAIVWAKPIRPSLHLILISVVLLIILVAGAFIQRRPPLNRRETIRLLDQIGAEKTLQKFFELHLGRLFWPLVSFLVMVIVLRQIMIF